MNENIIINPETFQWASPGWEGPNSPTIHPLQKCYLYQHMDSRGGSMAIIAKTLIQAHLIYSSGFIGEPLITGEDGEVRTINRQLEEHEQGMVDSLMEEDFTGVHQLLVIGGPAPSEIPDGELDKEFSGKYQLGRLQIRNQKNDRWTPWKNTNIILLIHEEVKFTITPLGNEQGVIEPIQGIPMQVIHRVVTERFDDDAFALMLVRESMV